MSKKGQQPRDKLGKFAKANPPPSSLATPIPRKPSRPAQPSSSVVDEPSSPDFSGISDLPGSFPSSAAASPVRQHSPPLAPSTRQPAHPQTTFPRLPASPQLTPTRQLITACPITHSTSTQTTPQPVLSQTTVQPALTKESGVQVIPQPSPTQPAATQTSPATKESTATQTAPTQTTLAPPTLSTLSALSRQPPRFGYTSLPYGPPAPAPRQRARTLSDSQPRSLATAPTASSILPPAFPLAPTMSTHTLTGPAAMPRPKKYPNFDETSGEPIMDFLADFDELADGHGLSDQQKVETILKYIPAHQKDLWKSLKGYATGNWTTFRRELEKLYPDMDAASRYSRQALLDLVNLSARTRMRDEKDVFEYYRSFLAISNPLHSAGQISSDERNAEFFRGFHPYDRTSIANRLYPLHPNRARNKPYDYEDVFAVARGYFADLQFYRTDDTPNYPPPPNPSRWPLREDRFARWSDPDPPYHQRDYDFPRDQRDRDFPRDANAHKPPRDPSLHRERDYRDPPPHFSNDFTRSYRDHSQPEPPRPDYETKTVRFTDQNQNKTTRDSNDLEDMVLKMHNLSVRDPAYAVLYAQICHHFPNAATPFPRPEFGQTTTVAYQTPAPQPTNNYNQRPQQNHHGLSDEAASFFGKTPRTDGCAFCTLQGHLVKRCPAAEEYVRSGCATIRDGRIHLGNGQPIPNDGSGRGLKHAIDSWLAGASTQPGESSPVTAIQTPGAAALSRDPPPHGTFSFEAVQHSTDWEEDSNSDFPFPDTDLYDLHEVLTAEEKRRTRASKLPEATPPPPVFPTPTPAPPTSPTPAPAPPTATPRPSGASRPPQFKYQASIEDQKFTDELIAMLLEGKLSYTTPAHILAASAPVRKALSDQLRPRRVETGAFEELGSQPDAPDPAAPQAADYSLPLREVEVVINDKAVDAGVLDQGSQIIAIRSDLAREAGAIINTKNRLEMEGANSSTSWAIGCAENLSMSIGSIKFQVHAYVVENAPFRLLLGRPFHNLLLSRLEDNADGSVNLSIHDPTDQSRIIQVPTKARLVRSGITTALAFQTLPSPPRMTAMDRHGLAQQITHHHTFPVPPTPVLAYKKAAKKVHPVAASLPEDFRITRQRPEDPIISLPRLPTNPPYFIPGLRLTQERLDAMNINKYKFLWPEEERLAQHVLKTNEHALAWTEAERGRFRDDYLAPVKIPTIAHTPWVHKNIPIPTGIMDEVIDLFKWKVAAGVYEPSDASYRSRWFCVKKKNGSLRIIHDLQPLNAVTIRNAAVPPFVDQFVESMAARACYSMLDLFVGYDHRTLDTSSRDLTSFQTPLGAFRCTVLPQGATNAVAIFHGDVTFILEPEIPHVAKPFVDDTAIQGPASRYETANGGYETIPENPGIRRFIWEHLNDVHRVIHRLGHAGATVSAPKLFIAAPEVVILGHKCNYNGRIPDESKTAKIKTWPACKTVTDVRAFLGTAGTMRIWIKNYSATARPLVDLTHKDAEFIWTPEHNRAMEDLKSAIINSPALIPIDYSTTRPSFLSIDSSWRAVGWILSQQGEDGQR